MLKDGRVLVTTTPHSKARKKHAIREMIATTKTLDSAYQMIKRNNLKGSIVKQVFERGFSPFFKKTVGLYLTNRTAVRAKGRESPLYGIRWSDEAVRRRNDGMRRRWRKTQKWCVDPNGKNRRVPEDFVLPYLWVWGRTSWKWSKGRASDHRT